MKILLSKREKLLLAIFLLFLLEIIFLNFILFPISDSISEIEFSILEFDNSIEELNEEISKANTLHSKVNSFNAPINPRVQISNMENVDGIFSYSSNSNDVFNLLDVVPISMRIVKQEDSYSVTGRLEHFNRSMVSSSKSLRDIYFNKKSSTVTNEESVPVENVEVPIDPTPKVKETTVEFSEPSSRVKSIAEVEESRLFIANGKLSDSISSTVLNISEIDYENRDVINSIEEGVDEFTLNYSLNSGDFLSIPIKNSSEDISILIYISENSRGNFKLLAHRDNTYYEFFPLDPIYPGRENILSFRVDNGLIVDGIVYEEVGETYEEGQFIFKEGLLSN